LGHNAALARGARPLHCRERPCSKPQQQPPRRPLLSLRRGQPTSPHHLFQDLQAPRASMCELLYLNVLLKVRQQVRNWMRQQVGHWM
jgi:hypothetical protein